MSARLVTGANPRHRPRTLERQVVAAVIDRDGRYLVGRRPASKHHGGRWEFPGGKVRDGESRAAAARRELREELALEVLEVSEALFTVAGEAESGLAIAFVLVNARGTPRALEHDELRWATLDELQRLDLAPADRRFVRERLARSGP